MTPSVLREIVILRRLTTDMRLEDLVEAAYKDVDAGREIYPAWRTSHAHIEEDIRRMMKTGLIDKTVKEGRSLIALSRIGELHIDRCIEHSPTRKQLNELADVGAGEALEALES